MSIAIDIFLVAVVVLCTIIGFHRGLIQSFFGFVGYLAATVASTALGGVLSVFLYQNFLRGMLIGKITEILTDTAAKTATEKAAAVLDGLPGVLGGALQAEGVTPESLGDIFAGSAQAAAPRMADLAAPLVINFSRLILTVLLFIVVLMLMRMLAHAVGTVFRLPLLRQLNEFLGAAFGFCSGAVTALLLCLLLQLVVPMMPGGLFGITRADLESSFIYGSIYKNNPVYSVFPEE